MSGQKKLPKINSEMVNRLRMQGALMTGVSIKKIARLKSCKKYCEKSQKIWNFEEKTKRYDFKKKRSQKMFEKSLKKKFKGKRGIGIKKLGKTMDMSSRTIRRWLKKT